MVVQTAFDGDIQKPPGFGYGVMIIDFQLWNETRLPPGGVFASAFRNCNTMAWRDFRNATENRMRRGNISERKIVK